MAETFEFNEYARAVLKRMNVLGVACFEIDITEEDQIEAANQLCKAARSGQFALLQRGYYFVAAKKCHFLQLSEMANAIF